MNSLKLILIALVLGVIGCDTQVESYKDKEKLRAYISTRLALAVMTTVDIPDEDTSEQCDGSGWITHGDGHKTECPGCSACEKDKGDIATEQESEYYVYHFGADWCAPCERLKKETWKDEKLKGFLKDKKVKLFMFNADDKEHEEFFRFYKVTSYPTVILLKKDKLSNVLSRNVGFRPAESMIDIFNSKIPKTVLEKDDE